MSEIRFDRVKLLSDGEKEILCRDLRDKIIQTVRVCGGHLSSNLGAIELTVGLFSVFDFPKDKIIWDVGHQCYAYKILSGRGDRFSTLRQRGGISGFPKRNESPFDSYDTGHAGNSVSAAIGLAKALELQKKAGHVIAVIGDGSFNNGLIYEALNSLSIVMSKILIVLNDNDMSISPTVGGTHELFSSAASTEEKKKNVALFEQYGLKYIGNVNGNDLNEVTAALQESKSVLDGGQSVLLHIKTKKGMGYDFCEENPMQTHGVSPENTQKSREYSQILGNTLIKLAANDAKIAVVTAAMTDALGLREFFEKYPERAFDVGICEENAAVLCASMAVGGMKPYYAIYSTFLQRAFDEVIHDICAQDLPVTFCVDRGGISGADGETHQGVFDLSYLSMIPNMTIAVPKDGEEFEAMIRFSQTYPHPLAIRYPRGACASFPPHGEIECGKFEYLTEKSGGKVTLLACGERAITLALSLREKAKEKFDVVNARFVKPLDEELLKNIVSPVVVTMEDNILLGGFGERVAGFYREFSPEKRVKIFAYEDKFIPHGSVAQLQKEYGLDGEEILRFIDEV